MPRPDEENPRTKDMPRLEFYRRAHYLDPRFKASLADYRDRWIIPFEVDSSHVSNLPEAVMLCRDYVKNGRLISGTMRKQVMADLLFEAETEEAEVKKFYSAMMEAAAKWVRGAKTRLRDEFELQKRWSGFPAPWLSAKLDGLGKSSGGALPKPEYLAKWIEKAPRANFRSARIKGLSVLPCSRPSMSEVKSWLENTLPACLADSLSKTYLAEMRELTRNNNWNLKKGQGKSSKLFVENGKAKLDAIRLWRDRDKLLEKAKKEKWFGGGMEGLEWQDFVAFALTEDLEKAKRGEYDFKPSTIYSWIAKKEGARKKIERKFGLSIEPLVDTDSTHPDTL